MPKFLLPWKSGAHRVAGIALYRALLSQSRRIDNIGGSQQKKLQTIVRNAFQKNRHVHSQPRLAVAFAAGYDAVELLDRSIAGDARAWAQIHDLLTNAPSHLTHSAKTKPVVKGTPVGRLDDVNSVLSRPRPEVPRKRQIPMLVSAQTVPILRFKKPQPPQLGAYLHKRHRQRQNRHDSKQEMENALGTAEHENEWDKILARQFHTTLDARPVSDLADSAESWTRYLSDGITLVNGRIHREMARNMRVARDMQEVIRKERELLAVEERQRKLDKKIRRKDRALTGAQNEEEVVGTSSLKQKYAKEDELRTVHSNE